MDDLKIEEYEVIQIVNEYGPLMPNDITILLTKKKLGHDRLDNKSFETAFTIDRRLRSILIYLWSENKIKRRTDGKFERGTSA